MKLRAYAGIIVLCVCLSYAFAHYQVPGPPTAAAIEDGISVYFSPRGGCTEAVVHAIDQARESVKIQVFSFTSAPIAQATAAAHKRGVKIIAILDARQAGGKYSSATFLYNQGIDTYIDATHASAHDKVMLIDGEVLVTGSFNFSKSAEEANSENLLIITAKPVLYAAFEKNFEDHLAHAIKYEGLRAKQEPPAADQKSDTTVDDRVTEPSGSVVVYATKSGSKYHRADCRFISKAANAITLDEARAKALTPCSVCQPHG